MRRTHIQTWIKEKKQLAVLVLLEIIVLLILTVISLRPQFVRILNAQNLHWVGDRKDAIERAEDGSVTFHEIDAAGWEPISYETENTIELPWGGYEVQVDYVVPDTNIRLDEWDATMPKFGIVDCYCISEELGLQSSKINLCYDERQARGRLYAGATTDIRNMQLRFTYSNNATIQITSVAIVERRIYRVLLIAAFIFFAVLVDVLFWFFTDERRKAEQKIMVLAVLVVTVLASLPCFGGYLFAGQDTDYHLVRIGALAAELQNGQFPVRMQTTVLNDAGYASSLFYGDLFLYVPAILYLLMVPLHTCYQIYFILFNFCTAIVSCLSFSKMFHSCKTGIVGMALYTLAMHRMICMYLRSGIGEYTAMTFLPLVAWGIWNIIKGKGKLSLREYLPLVVGMSCLIECHILTCEMLAIFGILFFLCNRRVLWKAEKLFAVLKAGLLTLGLNLFFLLPFLMSYGMEGLQVKLVENNRIREHGAYLGQLFTIFPSYEGNSERITMQGEMGMCVGMCLAVGCIVFVLCLVKKKEWGIEEEPACYYGKKMLWYSLLALFMSTIHFPWDLDLGVISDILWKVQFPWRYLEIATITMVLVTLCAITLLKKSQKQFYAMGTVVVTGMLCLISANYFCSGIMETAPVYRVYAYEDMETINVGGGAEYILGERLDLMAIKSGQPQIKKGKPAISACEKTGDIWRLTCANSGTTSVVMVPIMCYDNYIVSDSVSGERFSLMEGENHLMEITIPPDYSGTLEIHYQVPLVWHIAEFISLSVLIGLFLIKTSFRD